MCNNYITDSFIDCNFSLKCVLIRIHISKFKFDKNAFNRM